MVGLAAQQMDPHQRHPAGVAVAGLAKLVIDPIAPPPRHEDHPAGELELHVLERAGGMATLQFQEMGAGDRDRRQALQIERGGLDVVLGSPTVYGHAPA